MNGLIRRWTRFKAIMDKKGLPDAVEQTWESAVIKPLRSRIGWVRHAKEYPCNTIFIAGFAKSGSSWFANMVCELEGFESYSPHRWPLPGGHRHSLDIYPGLFKEPGRKLTVIKSHTCGCSENIRLLKEYGHPFLLVLRDPRDCLISAYWYIRRYKTHWDYEKVSTMALPEYIDYKLQSGEFESEFLSWVEEWLENADRSQTLILRYEDLIADTPDQLNRALQHLGIERSAEWIRRVAEKHSFRNVAGRKPGEENTGKFVRKGVAGEWREVFSLAQQELVLRIGQKVFEAAGYTG